MRNDLLPWLVMGGIAVMLGGFAWLNAVRNRKRAAAYADYSGTRGFTFEEKRPDWERRYADAFDVFTVGRRRRWGFTISGTKNGSPFTAFEYSWVTGGGKSSSTHWLSAIVWEADGANFPKFSLSPEGWLSRVGQFFGMQDIDFQDSPDFSRMYQLRGPDEPAIRSLFGAEIRRFFEATPDQHVSGGGRSLFWFQDRVLPSAEELDEWLEKGDQVRRRFFKP